MSTVIASVDHRSPAQRAGIRPGEKLLTINGHEIVDVLDYRFYGYDAKCRLELLEPNGSVRNVQIKKEEGLDLGLNFDTYLMDEMRCCANHCVFCFVDQMPPGMRQTLYFKDDDARLSFLQGNYITLTNLTEREAQRIIDLRISPINVSVHTTDPQLHCTMLGNKNAVRSLEYMRRFCEAGIVMNGQIVICPGWNDGDQLRRTLRDLTEMEFSSCSLVPVGITKYRKGLAKLRPVDAATAAEIIDIADEFGRENLERFGTRRFFCADELFLRAGRPLPEEDVPTAAPHYHDSADYLRERSRAGELWGIYEEGKLAGFMGLHEEGSMGILAILPEFRRRGLASVLESWVIGQQLKQGQVPYGHVIEGNDASTALQESLGLTKAELPAIWVF